MSSSLSPVLITGGNGFIAYHIIAKLLVEEPNCTIHSLDINPSRNRHNHPSVTYHHGDLSSLDDVQRIMNLARPVTIFHTASPEFSSAPIPSYHSTLVTGTHHLLTTAAHLGTVKALVHTSTSGVINDNHSDLLNATEDLPILHAPQQKRPYCLAKAAAEEAVQAANRTTTGGFLTCSLRPCLVFGERDTNALGRMVAVARQGRSRFQIGDGQNAYDFVYAGNLATAHLLVARALVAAYGRPAAVVSDPDARRVEGEVFNITNGEPWLFWDFQREIAAQLGQPVEKRDVVVIPKWLGLVVGVVSEWVAWAAGWGAVNMTAEGIRFSTLVRTLNGEKAERVLGYRAEVGMKEAIERSVRWFVENPGAVP